MPSPIDDQIDARADSVAAADPIEADQTADDAPGDPASIHGSATLDLAAAAAVLGGKVRRDDLTVIEGIGPKISELCHGIGIQTWADLAQTEASLLRAMLQDAGPRFRTHDPETWPEQASLLAVGRWEEFRALTDRLDGGRVVD